MITALVVDDEKKNRETLQKLLIDNCPDVHVLDSVPSVADALQFVRKHHPQVVFLDIEMPGQNGFDFLKKIDKIDFKVIFVTAHSHYAIRAIKFSAVDYLLKPVDEIDLKQAVEKVILEINRNHEAHYKGLLENLAAVANYKLAVSVRDGIAFLDTNDIIRLEADGTYTHIFCNSEKFTATKNIKEFEDILADQGFFRSHKSHLINMKHVKRFSRADGYFVQMSDGSRAEVSRRKQEEFISIMSRH